MRKLVILAAVAALTMTVLAPAGAADYRTIKGKITDKKTGEPAVGVVVSLSQEGMTGSRIACTGDDGSFRFKKTATSYRYAITIDRHLQKPKSESGKCTNWRFDRGSGKAWLRYVHPGHHGVVVYPPDGYFDLEPGSKAFNVPVRLRTGKYVCEGFLATQWGTNGNDTLIGTGDIDIIVGRGGNDVIEGRGGTFDILCGDGGNDTLKGGGGADILFGGAGKGDKMIGGADSDLCVDNKYKKRDCEVTFNG